MTLLPGIELCSSGVLLTLEDGSVTLLRTATQARQLQGLLALAETELEELSRQREMAAGRATNARYRATNDAFGVLPQVYERPPAQPLCTCNRFIVCETHIVDTSPDVA